MNINEVAVKLQEANPALMFGVSATLIAVFSQDADESITGQFVSLQGQGLPLINGERVYQQSDFITV
jgi:hypothetical protein